VSLPAALAGVNPTPARANQSPNPLLESLNLLAGETASRHFPQSSLNAMVDLEMIHHHLPASGVS
jgi:hypothetical protein